jgi:hypothetical protein
MSTVFFTSGNQNKQTSVPMKQKEKEIKPRPNIYNNQKKKKTKPGERL